MVENLSGLGSAKKTWRGKRDKSQLSEHDVTCLSASRDDCLRVNRCVPNGRRA